MAWTEEGSNPASWTDAGEEDSWDPHEEDDIWESSTEGPCSSAPRSDILWLVTDLPSYEWPNFNDEPYSFLRSWLPDGSEVWNTYYIPGYQNLSGNPWQGYPDHYPWYHNDPGETPPNDWNHGRYNNIGVSYDHVNHRLTFMQVEDSSLFPIQVTNIDFSDLDNPIITTTDLGTTLRWYSDFQETIVDFETSTQGCFRYCYPKADGSPVLIASSYYGDMAISLNNGVSWTLKPDLGHNYVGEGLYSYLAPQNYYSIEWGPVGSDTIAVVGKYTIWKTSDNGATWEPTWVCYGASDWNPPEPDYAALENGLIYETYAIGCNKKADPDCVWITMGWRSDDLPDEGICQRNTSDTCEHDDWEDRTYTVVSTEYERSILERTVVYPNDWPVVPQRGEEFIVRCIPTAIKYFESRGRFWAFCFRDNLTLCNPNDSNFLLFSDDDGKTWSNILCDHKNESNWQYMHPFFSPRCWPFSRVADGWTKCTEMNFSGFGAVCDIVEHPDDPDIVITIGYHWLRSNETVVDPAGRGDGNTYFVAPDATVAEKATYAQYSPGLRSLGNYKAVYCVSMDGGLTWGDVTCTMPTWEYPYAKNEFLETADADVDVFYQNYYYASNPSSYRLFPIVSSVQGGGEATGHEPGWDPTEEDENWTAE